MTAYKYQKQHASNYNYKGKRSFGQRIKNFFTIPEEDLKEEPSKEFEKIKLFTLTRGSLFLGILVFMILINLLVGFNINFLYIRQILGFLFLILIPGLLIMLCFKIRTVKFWEYLVYTVGLSIAFIMFAGLAVNWTLPVLNITDKPLSLWPILICFDIFLLGLWLTAIYRNKDLKPFDITIPKLDTLNRIFFIIPMTFPLLSILGAFLLNNHGPNILTMIMLGGIAVYVLFITIFRKRMNENVWPWALYWMGLALLLSFSMRGWYITGSDIHSEHFSFVNTINLSHWIPNISGSYSTMLSVTILPTIINKFTNFNLFFTSKFFFQILFSFSPLIIFLLILNITNSFKNKNIFIIFSFLSSLFFISQSQFLIYYGWIRQEIALIFFGLIFLILFKEDINSALRKILFIAFGASMIVSHYSTAYIALGILILAYIFILTYKINEKRKIKKGKLNEKEKKQFYLTGTLILFFILFGFLWYNQVTPIGEGLIDFTSRSLVNLENIFNKDVMKEGGNWIDQINPFYKAPNQASLIRDYQENIIFQYQNISKIEGYDFNQTSNPISVSIKDIPSPRFNTMTSYRFALFIIYLRKIVRLLLFLGILSLFFMYKNNKIKLEYALFIWVMFISFCLILILPFSSMSYNTMRLYQQMLFLLSLPTIFGLFFVFPFGRHLQIRVLLVSMLIILYLLINTGTISYIIGGQEVLINYENKGPQYEEFATFSSEVYSSIWVNSFSVKGTPIYADHIASYRLKSLGLFNRSTTNDIIPQTISKDSYVFLSHRNFVLKRGYLPSENVFLKRNAISYNFPIDFLEDNKNKIYNNGGSGLFR